MCVREKNMKAARWREQERRYHMTVITLFPNSAFQTKGSLNQNRQMGTPGGNFPAPPARKEIHVRLSEQKKNQKKTLLLSNKCRLFLKSACRQGGGVTTEALNPRVNKASVLMFQLCKTDGAVFPRSWMRWSGGEVSPQLWSTPS